MSITSTTSIVADVFGGCDVTVHEDGAVTVTPTLGPLEFTASGFYAFLRHIDAASGNATELADKLAEAADEEEES